MTTNNCNNENQERQVTTNSEQQSSVISEEDQKIAEAFLTAYIYSTVKQFCIRHQAFTEGGIRHDIFHEKSNGLKESGAIVRKGRKIIINEQRYFNWLESNNKDAS